MHYKIFVYLFCIYTILFKKIKISMHSLRINVLTLFFFVTLSTISAYSGTTPFVTTWGIPNTKDNNGLLTDNEVLIPARSIGFNYTVDWGDGVITKHVNESAVHSYSQPGIYTISITGDFPDLNFRSESKLLTIEQWGNNKWESMAGAFYGCYNLQGNFSDVPNLSNVNNMEYMFFGANSFNYDINNWDVSNVTNMQYMFSYAFAFNQNLNEWDVSNVTNMEGMFSNAQSLNQDIGRWNVTNVRNMKQMFSDTHDFNQNIGNWDVSNVVDMEAMFLNAQSFNQNIGDWNVSEVTTMNRMFHLAVTFNQDIGNWDVGHVIDMSDMFSHAFSFNQYIGNWEVSNVINMIGMFYIARSFNQDLSQWDVTKVRDMRLMFAGATQFDQDLGVWNVVNVTDMGSMFSSVKLSIHNYDSLLNGWSKLNLQSNVFFTGGLSKYCQGAEAREKMVNNFNWDINDDGSAAALIANIDNQEGIDHYTLPTITGERLTGNEKYYTAPNAKGTAYNAGDVINFQDYASYPITLYVYDAFNSICADEKSFQLKLTTSTLSCSSLLTPTPRATNVSANTTLEWSAVVGAEGYKLSLGTAPGKTNLMALTDVGNVLNYNFIRSFPGNTTVFVNIIPYNANIENTDCSETLFITESFNTTGIPKFFTPNDDGYYDTWVVPDPLNTISSIFIYDCYGKLLKQITDVSKGWDGIYLNNPLPTNDYWYTIEYKDGNILSGHFSLVR